jgi:hypothetical protein
MFIPLLLLCAASAFSGTFGLDCQGDAGYETGLYDPADSSYKSSPFFSPSVEPACILNMDELWRTEMRLPVSATLRPFVGQDLNGGPEIDLVREKEKNSLFLNAAAEYEKQPASPDPDKPQQDMNYGLTAGLSNKGDAALKLSYALSVLKEIRSARRDLNNLLRLKMTFKPTDWFSPGFGAGLGRNTSTVRGYNYSEFDFSLTSTAFAGEKNMLMGVFYFTRRNYPATDFAGGTVRKLKGVMTQGVGGKVRYLTNNYSLMLDFSRELTGRLDFEASYDYQLYVSQIDRKSNRSQSISAGISWRLNPL